MRETLNKLEERSDHRILCMTSDERRAVLEALDDKGYMWPSNRSLTLDEISAPTVLFTYKNGTYGKKEQKIVLYSSQELKPTAENQIITAAEWLRGNKYFDGVDCTIPEETA